MPASAPLTIFQFIVAVAANIAALGLLPATQGFTRPLPTLGCLALFVVNLWLISRLIEGGAGLSLLMPLLAAVIPLSTMAMGIMIYGESASPMRIGLLIVACLLAGAASLVPN